MATKKVAPVRKPRVDAERNRVHLLDTAKSVFAKKGSGASLEEIARVAGVGIGTLYRHFPTRDALVEAVYRNETEQLTSAAARLAKTHSPVEAMRAWMLLFIDYIATKDGMSEVLNGLVGGTSALYESSSEPTKSAFLMLTERAVKSGEVTFPMDPVDLLRALAGVAHIGANGDWRAGAKQLVDIMIAGLRMPQPTRPTKPKRR